MKMNLHCFANLIPIMILAYSMFLSKSFYEFNIFLTSVNLASVSYTHLDVYKRQAMKAAKEKGEVYKAEELENGDTLRQLLARSRYLLFKSPDKWTKSQKIRAELLFKQFEDIKHVYYYSLELGKIFSTNYDKDVARAKLALWYNKIEEYGYDTFTTVANSIENHYERILNFFVNRSTNAAAEAFNAKIKAFRASFRGVVDMSFFLFRLAKVYA